MTESELISSPRPAKAVDRRALLKAGAWAAPAIVVAAASPAWAASTDPVTIAMITVTSGALTNTATLGPLNWAGGTIKYTGTATSLPSATFSYTAKITGPGIAAAGVTLASGTEVISKGATFTVPAPANYGTAPMAGGDYTVTLTATITVGGSGSKAAASSVTLVGTVGTSTPNNASLGGNRYALTVQLTGNAPFPDRTTVVSTITITSGSGAWDVGGGTGPKPGTASIGAGNVLSVVFPAWKKANNNAGYTYTWSITVPGYPSPTATGSGSQA